MSFRRSVSVRSRMALAVLSALTLVATQQVAAGAGEPTGSLSFLPSTGNDASSLTAVSSGTCTDARGGYLQLRVSGAGFPDDTNVTPVLAASLYPIDPSSSGYDVPLQNTLQAFAAQQTPPAELTGTYTFRLVCRGKVNGPVFGLYTGSLTFGADRHYRSDAVAGTATPATSGAPTAAAVPLTAAPRTTAHASVTTSPTGGVRHGGTTSAPRSSATSPAAAGISSPPRPVAGRTTTGAPAPALSTTRRPASSPTPATRPTSAPLSSSAAALGSDPSTPLGASSSTTAAAMVDEASSARPNAGRPGAGAVVGLLFLALLGVGGLGVLARRRIRQRGGSY